MKARCFDAILTPMCRIFCLYIFVWVSSVWASGPIELTHSTAQFVSEYDAMVPGEASLGGLQVTPLEGWHVYWKNPGDSGSVPVFNFESDGIEFGEIQYSSPKRFAVGPLHGFGYDQATMYVVSMTPSKQLNIGNDVRATLQAQWLVCQESCIPQKASFDLEWELKPTGDVKPTVYQPAFDLFRSSRPTKKLWNVSFDQVNDEYNLYITGVGSDIIKDFFPAPKSPVSNAPAVVSRDGKTVVLSLEREATSLSASKPSGLVVYESGGVIKTAIVEPESSSSKASLALLFAFLGGLILNLMPCVLPVISMKYLSLAGDADKSARHVRLGSLSYCLGVLTSFMALAALLVGLRESGQSLGWGFQLQSPVFIVVLCFLFWLLGANFLNWFQFSIPIPDSGVKLMRAPGLLGHFFTGVLSTIVASPCTAPFMGAALGFALSQSGPLVFLIFFFLGLGLSFPYLAFAVFPSAVRFLPRPGHWMETLKEFLAFPMFATVIWLLWVLGQQSSVTTVAYVLGALLVLGGALWIRRQLPSRLGTLVALILVFSSCWLGFSNIKRITQTAAHTEGELKWTAYSPQVIESLRADGRRVFVDFTAAWCITCQANEEVIFSNAEVLALIAERNIALVKADWTDGDPVITEAIESFGRAGVPVYVLYHGSKEPQLLPELLTPDIVLKALNEL